MASGGQVISPPAAKGIAPLESHSRLRRSTTCAKGAYGIFKALGLEPPEAKSPINRRKAGSQPDLISKKGRPFVKRSGLICIVLRRWTWVRCR